MFWITFQLLKYAKSLTAVLTKDIVPVTPASKAEDIVEEEKESEINKEPVESEETTSEEPVNVMAVDEV